MLYPDGKKEVSPALRQAQLDKVTLLGTAMGLASFFFLGYLTYRPNRLASGSSLPVWEAVSPLETAILPGLWALILLFAFLKGNNKGLNFFSGMAASAIFFTDFWLAGISAGKMVAAGDQFARVSLGAGAWVTALSAYIVLFASRRHLAESMFLKLTVSILGPFMLLLAAAGGHLNELSIAKEFLSREERFIREFFQHITLSGLAVGAGVFTGVPLGIWAFRSRLAEKVFFFFANTVQTIPSLALFGLLIAPLSLLSEKIPFLRQAGVRGIGWTPALIALALYSLLPIIRNVYTGLKIIDPGVIDAGLGMGMSRLQLLLKVEIPLALPVILSGIRTAAVQSIGNTTVAALIGAGGFGTFVFQGLGQAAPDLILLGAIPVILMALAADILMQELISLLTPKGISGGQR
jgi:osmoprotectant transport system permease protein